MQNSYYVKGWQRVLLIIIPYLFISAVFMLAFVALSNVGPHSKEEVAPSYSNLGTILFSSIGGLLIVLLFTRTVDKEPLKVLGLQWKGFSSYFILGLVSGMIMIITGFGILFFVEEITVVNYAIHSESIIISLLQFMIVAISEEIFCRGYILRNLIISANKWVALVISSMLFALLHLANPSVDYISLTHLFFSGMTLGLFYIYTKNLWFSIGLHFTWNLSQSWLGFNVSGRDAYSFLELNYLQENFMNGGTFGFEGSILSILIEIPLLVGIYVYFTKFQSKRLTNNNDAHTL